MAIEAIYLKCFTVCHVILVDLDSLFKTSFYYLVRYICARQVHYLFVLCYDVSEYQENRIVIRSRFLKGGHYVLQALKKEDIDVLQN